MNSGSPLDDPQSFCRASPRSAYSLFLYDHRSSSAMEAPITVRTGNVAASRGSRPGHARRRLAASLLLVALAPGSAMAQRAPQPIFTELFAYDPAVPSQLLKKWLISP